MENIILAIPLTSFDTTTIAGTTYYAINANGLDETCFFLRIINNSNINLTISYDAGTTARDCVQTNSTFQLGGFSDKQLNWQKGQKFYVRNSAAAGGAGVGLVYLAGYYR